MSTRAVSLDPFCPPPKRITQVVLAGGSSALPALRTLISKMTGIQELKCAATDGALRFDMFSVLHQISSGSQTLRGLRCRSLLGNARRRCGRSRDHGWGVFLSTPRQILWTVIQLLTDPAEIIETGDDPSPSNLQNEGHCQVLCLASSDKCTTVRHLSSHRFVQ